VLARPVHAQDDKARARALFGDGVSAYEQGNFSVALESFQQAYRLAPHPAVRVNMANCFEQLGRYAEAIFNYERFLDESGSAVAPEQRTEVETAIQRLKGKIGSLVIQTDPADAGVAVDGEPVSRSQAGVPLASGQHSVRVFKDGFVTAERMVQVEGGGEQRITISLAPEAAAQVEPSPIPALREEVSASASEPAEDPFATTRSDQPARLRPLMWISLGSALLLGAGGAVTGVMALGAQHDFDNAVKQSNDPTLAPVARDQARANGLHAADRADVRATVTDVLLAGSALTATTAFVLWLMDRKREHAATQLSVSPALGGHGPNQLILRGAF
jgi:hypothetical protein